MQKQLVSTLYKIKAPTPHKERREKGKIPRIGFTAPDFRMPIISKIPKSGVRKMIIT